LRSAAILPVWALSFTTSLVAQTYNPAAAFEQGFTTQRNPSGVWSYGYSSGFTGAITLFNHTVQGGYDSPNEQLWLSSSVDIGYSPAVELNNGPPLTTATLAPLRTSSCSWPGLAGNMPTWYSRPPLLARILWLPVL
jgi:hypothetical protein